MNYWRLLPHEAGDAAWNMAVDEAVLQSLLEQTQPPTLRVYQWSKPSVSLGRFQRAERVVDLSACHRRGVPVVQRLTGGKAVLHGHDITLSVVAPLDVFAPARQVIDVHLFLINVLAAAFRELGVETCPVHRVNVAALRGTHSNCFEHVLPGDLATPEGVKLAGGAQYRRADVVLEQISIPCAQLPEALEGILLPWTPLPVSPLVGTSRQQLIGALCRGFARAFRVEWLRGDLSSEERERARRWQERYAVLPYKRELPPPACLSLRGK